MGDMKHFNRVVTVLVVLAAAAAGLAVTHTAGAAGAWQSTPTPEPTPVDSRAVITDPGAGKNLSGVAAITGSAFAPDFDSYLLEYAPDPLPTDVEWLSVQPSIEQQVIRGVLGAWDTAEIADGRYILRLTLNRTASDPIVYEVRVQVSNATPTPAPTLTPQPTDTPRVTVGPGQPTPTPLIQQPPTRTPRPTVTPGGPTATPAPLVAGDSPLRPDRLVDAARRGVWIALIIFGVLGMYGLIRAAVRGTLRDGLLEVQHDVIHPLIDELRRSRDRRRERRQADKAGAGGSGGPRGER
jgi:hypothetical protein